MDFDVTGLNPSAMWDEKSNNSKIEIVFAIKHHTNVVYVEAFNIQSFDQDGNGSAILKIKCNNPPYLIFQQLSVKEKVKNIEVNGMRNAYIIDILTSVDIQQVSKIEEKVVQIYKRVI